MWFQTSDIENTQCTTILRVYLLSIFTVADHYK